MHAYDQIYLDGAQKTLGSMFDYAVQDLNIKLEDIHGLFRATSVADRFGMGEADYVVGCSGMELAGRVLEAAGLQRALVEPSIRSGYSRNYWTGWALAYYQWQSGMSFDRIEQAVPIRQIYDAYSPYHEMDISQFADMMDDRCQNAHHETMLARLRAYAGYSQSLLAEKSGVPLRTIQQYEQRQKDISKAGATQLEHLARALWCDARTLMEDSAH